ncbi:MAG: hypothetical protein GEU73_09915 [Chloroflexi bacterium]|nr:hypothetical protein [Chloroflexota bacterium]
MNESSAARWRRQATPDASDPFVSVGFLIAAGATTVIGLVGYTVMLVERLASARARREELQTADRDSQRTE